MEDTAQKIIAKMLTEINEADVSARGALIRELQTMINTMDTVHRCGGFAALCGHGAVSGPASKA